MTDAADTIEEEVELTETERLFYDNDMESRYGVDIGFVEKLLDDARARKLRGDMPMGCWHAMFNAMNVKFRSPKSSVLEMVVCHAYGIDRSSPRYTHIGRMKWNQVRDLVASPAGRLVVVPFSAGSQRRVEWLWDGRIPLGALTLIAGEPEVGKTSTATDVMARSSTGRVMPDGTPGRDGMWLYVSSENDMFRTVKPRIVAAGGDVTRISFIKATEIKDKTIERRAFSLEQDIAALDELLTAAAGECVGIVLDPLNEYLGPNVNSWRDGDVLRVLGPLVDLAEKHQVALVGIMHPAKGEASTVLNKILGSKAFTMKARSILFCVEEESIDSQDKARSFLMLNEKNSLAEKAPGLRYHFEIVAPRAVEGDDPAEIAMMRPVPFVSWHEGTVDVRMRDLAEAQRNGRSSTVADCMVWLLPRLSDGPVNSATVMQEGEAMGFGPSPMKTAKKKLGVISRKVSFGSGWTMELPSEKDPNGNFMP